MEREVVEPRKDSRSANPFGIKQEAPASKQTLAPEMMKVFNNTRWE
jgi:hypothetical protein